jgi:hypothetical protein
MSEPLQLSLSQTRDRVIEALSKSFADDDLSLEELERRLERAYKATTVAELDELTADLRSAAASKARTPVPVSSVSSTALVVEHERIVAIMSESKRGGLWSVPQALDLLAFMSDTSLDLTHAQLPTGIIDIHARSMMATMKIILPPGVHVVNRLHAIMSSVHNELDEQTPPPGAAVIRLSGWAFMAEVKVLVRRREE